MTLLGPGPTFCICSTNFLRSPKAIHLRRSAHEDRLLISTAVDCFTERHPAIQHEGISQATPKSRRTWEILVIFSRHSPLISVRRSPGKHDSLGPELLPALLTATSSRANNASVHVEVLPCHFLQVKKGTPPVRHTSGCHYNSAIGGRIRFL